MTKWRHFMCISCNKYFKVKPGISQHNLECPKCSGKALERVKKREYEKGVSRGL